MKLFTVDAASIALGQPLEFSLRSADGVLLARRGHLFFQRSALVTLAAHGSLYVAMEEAQAYRNSLKRQMAAGLAEPEPGARAPLAKQSVLRRLSSVDAEDTPVDWPALQERTHALLHSPQEPNFLKRVASLQEQIMLLVRQNPDATLLALTHMAAEEDALYSATHALFVGAISSMAAHEVLRWSEEREAVTVRAALTMNISMTQLQDRLALQVLPLTHVQQEQVHTHAQRSVALLQSLGVADAVWLDAVAAHHREQRGALQNRTPAQQVARLIHRADIFAARLSPRASRSPQGSQQAMRAAYFDEERQVDEAGAALIKVLGIHHPGELVTLATGEVAIVVRRSANGLSPVVAVLINRKGMPLADPVLRDTRQFACRIVSSVSHTEVKVRSDVLRVLAVARIARVPLAASA